MGALASKISTLSERPCGEDDQQAYDLQGCDGVAEPETHMLPRVEGALYGFLIKFWGLGFRV